jgi:hypothetical protein
MKRSTLVLAALWALVLAVLARPAAAAPHATLVIVPDTSAPSVSAKALGGKLPEPWRVGDEASVRRALRGAGQLSGPTAALEKNARARLAKAARLAATDIDAQAVLLVGATSKHGKRTLHVILVSPNEVDPVVDTDVESSKADDGPAVLDLIGPALLHIAPLRAEPAAPAPPSSPVSSAPPPDAGSAGGPDGVAPPPSRYPQKPTIFELSAGGGSGSRFFRYNDALSAGLRTYNLPAAPNVVVAAELYPFARLSVPVIRNIGFDGGFQHAIALSSATSNGMSVGTNWWRAEGDLRLRFPLGEGARHAIGVRGGVVAEHFGFTSGDAMLTTQLPDVDYLFWRVGAFGRAAAGPIAFLLDVAYMPAWKSGALADRFRESTFAAVEFGGGLAVPVVRVFEFRATADYMRVFYAFHPNPGDAYVAGGALDQFVRAQLTANLRL